MSAAVNATLTAASQIGDLVRRSTSPLPTAPDGRTDLEAAPPSERPTLATIDFIDGLRAQIQRGAPLKLDQKTIVRKTRIASRSARPCSSSPSAEWHH